MGRTIFAVIGALGFLTPALAQVTTSGTGQPGIILVCNEQSWGAELYLERYFIGNQPLPRYKIVVQDYGIADYFRSNGLLSNDAGWSGDPRHFSVVDLSIHLRRGATGTEEFLETPDRVRVRDKALRFVLTFEGPGVRLEGAVLDMEGNLRDANWYFNSCRRVRD